MILPRLTLLLLLIIPLLFASYSRADNKSPLFDSIYLRTAPSTQNGVIDLLYKDKKGNWKKFNSITPVVTVNGQSVSAAQAKISYTTEMLTDGLTSRPDLTRAKFQFDPFPGGAHIYLLMDMEQGKPYAKFSVFKNLDSADINELTLASINGLEQLVQKIKINATTFEVVKCDSYSPGCSDIRTIKDGAVFPLIKPENRIISLIGETGVKQLIFTDQDYAKTDRIETTVVTKGASKTQSLASPSAKRSEVPYFGTTSLIRSPFDGTGNNWFFGIDTESIIGQVKATTSERRNVSFRVKFSGVDTNAGPKNAQVVVKKGLDQIFDKRINLVGTGTGVYVGTLSGLPGMTDLSVFIKDSKSIFTHFNLPSGLETVDWTATGVLGGDANGDDRVDSSDFALLQRDYMQNITSGADFNGDTRLDSKDLSILQDGYLQKSAKP